MTPAATNAALRTELEQLRREGLIDNDTLSRLRDLYPVARWDWRSLGRWFLIFGAVSLAAGAAIFLREIIHFTLEKLAIQLAIGTVALAGAAQWLKRRAWHMVGQTLEFLAAFSLIGLTLTLGMIYSTGSGHWSTLLLIDLLLILPASYALNNRLLLVLSAVLFFVWFGGRTGYTGWGYWFGMNYPLRFVAAGGAMIALGCGHMMLENTALARFRGYAKIWLSTGLFVTEMALWLLSLFGAYTLIDGPWHIAGTGEIFLFNALWALFSLSLIVIGARLAFRMVTAYGATFLIIQAYTIFFAHAAESIGYILSSFLAGAAALALAALLESHRRAAGASPDPGS